MTETTVDWKFIPYLDQMFEVIATTLPYSKDDPINILSLGNRTLELSAYLLNIFSNSQITLVGSSSSSELTQIYPLRNYGARLKFIEKDFAREELPVGFQALISSFAIHSLDNIETRGLYRSAYRSLTAGGILVIADRMAPPSSQLGKQYKKAWENYMYKIGASEEEISKSAKMLKKQNQRPVLEHLHWLRQAGFQDVDIFYKHLLFSVHGGRRPNPIAM